MSMHKLMVSALVTMMMVSTGAEAAKPAAKKPAFTDPGTVVAASRGYGRGHGGHGGGGVVTAELSPATTSAAGTLTAPLLPSSLPESEIDEDFIEEAW